MKYQPLFPSCNDLFPCKPPHLSTPAFTDDQHLLLSVPGHNSMEDREQSSNSGTGDHSRPSSSTSLSQSPSRISHKGNSTESLPIIEMPNQSSFASSNTYIVQVPRNQVYRVPPPENAIFVENYRKDHQIERKKTSGCGSFSCRSLIIVTLIFLIIVAMVGSCLAIFLTYVNPRFSIDHFHVKKKNSSHVHHLHNKQSLEYDIKMKVHNPNKYHEISYYKDDYSNVTLSSKRKQIASGKFPDFDQGSKGSTIVNLRMHGSTSQLPKAIARSMNSTTHYSKTQISLSLKMNVPVKIKVGALNVKSKKMDASCSFLVDRFNKDHARVVTQECTTSG